MPPSPFLQPDPPSSVQLPARRAPGATSAWDQLAPCNWKGCLVASPWQVGHQQLLSGGGIDMARHSGDFTASLFLSLSLT